jgi:uncharacterized membrane protein
MDISTLLMEQFTDVFRLGLLAALIYTTERTRPQTGVVLPLVAGSVFIAIIIPATMSTGGVSQWLATATGVIVNLVVAALFWLAWQAVLKSRR